MKPKKLFILETREGSRFLLNQCRVVVSETPNGDLKGKPRFLLSYPNELRRLATALELENKD